MAKSVLPSTIRAWARENLDLIPEAARESVALVDGKNKRGRLNPEVAKAYKAANKGVRIERPAPTVTVRVAALDKNGKAITKPVTVPTAAARELLGQSGVRGRFNKDNLAVALEAQALAEADLSAFV